MPIFSSLIFTENRLQTRVKNALDLRFKNCLKHDWLEDGHTFPLMQYYTDLVWTRMVKEAMGKKGKTMKGIDEILKVPGAGEKCCKILVEGEYVICLHVNYISKIKYGKTIDMFFLITAGSGMGKSSSMAYLAMKWVKDKKGGEYMQQYYCNKYITMLPYLLQKYATGNNKTFKLSSIHFRISLRLRLFNPFEKRG